MALFIIFLLAVAAVYYSSRSERLERLERELAQLKIKVERLAAGGTGGEKPAQARTEPEPSPEREELPSRAPAAQQPAQPEPEAYPGVRPAETPAPESTEPVMAERAEPTGEPLKEALKSEPAIDWEQFAGIKLFAWIGGFALFLGAGFFVKYSIDHGLLSPLVRVTLSFLLGGGCIGAGLWLKDGRYTVTARTLCAAGIAILYADIFAANAVYHFIGATAAFMLMSLVTAASFLLAVRMDSKYVALLGLIGGFLTPPMLSTGVDRPLGLFGYVLLLDLGVAATAFKTGWTFLFTLSLIGTGVMEAGWFAKFFTDAKLYTGAAVTALFAAFASAVIRLSPAYGVKEEETGVPCGIFLLFSLGLAAYMLNFGLLASTPGVLFLLLLFINGAFAYNAYKSGFFGGWHAGAAFLVFLLIAQWSLASLKAELLWQAFAFYLAFAALNAALPVIKWKLKGEKPGGMALSGVYPLLGLVLVLLAMGRQSSVSFFFWPVVLLLNVLAVGAGFLVSAMWIGVAGLALTVCAGFIWLSKIGEVAALTGFMTVFALFTVGFLALAVYLLRLLKERAGEFTQDSAYFVNVMPYLTALSPFLLIITAALKLKPDDPSMIFGFGLLMSAVMLTFARIYSLGALSLPALAGSFLLAAVWHANCFVPARAAGPLLWYIAYALAFVVFPAAFRERFRDAKPPWIAAAAAGPLFFILVYDVAISTVGKELIGFLPAAFAAVYFRLLRGVMKHPSSEAPIQDFRLALTGGVALFFITLIFPLQFDKQWLTLAWALEGAALVCFFGRVPHEGLKKWGYCLLVISFARLALNPAVTSYHPRQGVAVFNWFLYSYLTAAAAMFAAAALWRPAEEKYFGTGVKSALMAGGAALLFLLLNIEIADYFSTGAALTFQFSGNVARDLAYTLGWSLFALGLFGFGIKNASAAARKASFGIFAAAILKLFLHDIWSLAQLYRVAAFMVTAVILIVVSFFYQKYLAGTKAPAGGKSAGGGN